ncbi:hypothetical protein ABOM_007733 [Aspergillus bombycis]|uniref:Uncharacterized protein n=1 Tax=Aspergillus bombycis TaxID=109264 RepID=A0A1F7ZYT5_9EURO|nr:hypothetical protein ABOM_007733 [Aspergillus bombycis]OGM44255.1 hypothetical protein ABOM_007733 [Aspergillus bombycis]
MSSPQSQDGFSHRIPSRHAEATTTYCERLHTPSEADRTLLLDLVSDVIREPRLNPDTRLNPVMTVSGADPFISLYLRQSPGCVPMGLATTTNQRRPRGAVDPELLPVPLLCRPFPRTSAGLTGSWLSVSTGLFSNRLRALDGNAGSVVNYPRVPDGHWP